MFRLVACLVLAAAAVPLLACGKGRSVPQPILATALADTVVTGTVVDIAEDLTVAKAHPDAPDVTAYTVATVRIDSPLLGAKNLTHVRVGVPAGTLDRAGAPFHRDGKFLLFLQKHPVAGCLVPSYTHPTVDLNVPGTADTLQRVTAATRAFNDPVAALSATDRDDRTLAAVALAMRYRRIPDAPKGYEPVDRPADESRLFFAALAEADWTATATPETGNVYGTMFGLGLEQQGLNVSGLNGDPVKVLKDRFTEWLKADGKTARLKQFVAKK